MIKKKKSYYDKERKTLMTFMECNTLDLGV